MARKRYAKRTSGRVGKIGIPGKVKILPSKKGAIPPHSLSQNVFEHANLSLSKSNNSNTHKGIRKNARIITGSILTPPLAALLALVPFQDRVPVSVRLLPLLQLSAL